MWIPLHVQCTSYTSHTRCALHTVWAHSSGLRCIRNCASISTRLYDALTLKVHSDENHAYTRNQNGKTRNTYRYTNAFACFRIGHELPVGDAFVRFFLFVLRTTVHAKFECDQAHTDNICSVCIVVVLYTDSFPVMNMNQWNNVRTGRFGSNHVSYAIDACTSFDLYAEAPSRVPMRARRTLLSYRRPLYNKIM